MSRKRCDRNDCDCECDYACDCELRLRLQRLLLDPLATFPPSKRELDAKRILIKTTTAPFASKALPVNAISS